MYDTVIIGSGPAGLSAAVYAKRAMLNCVVIEKDYMGTGQIAVTERVDNYLGLYGKSGYDLGVCFRSHALELGAEFYDGEVVKIVPNNDFYNLLFADNKIVGTRTIIFAAGANPRKLNIKGEKEFSGKGVSYCAVCDGAFYRNKTVAVIGGGDTALQDAVLLSKIAKTVYIIHRRDEFRANKTLQNAVINTKNIKLVLNSVPVEIFGDKKVNSIKIKSDDTEKILDVDGVFVAVGTTPNSSLLSGIVNLDKNGYVIADEDGVTSADGIFAAGDVRTKRLRQIVTAVSDGANCVHSVEEYLN